MSETENTQHRRRKHKRRGRRRDEPVHYAVEIREWDWSFMFGVNRPNDRDGPYSDYRHLHLHGTLLTPKKVKAQKVELIFLPKLELNEDKREHPIIWAGHLSLHRGLLTGLISIPSDALPLVLQMVIAGQFRFAVMSGGPLRYRQAAVHSYRLQRTFGEDDLPFGEFEALQAEPA